MQSPCFPLFTVIMPCFNASTTVGTAIASVLAQSETRFELIVVDDGSNDDSVTAALNAIGGDYRARVLSQVNRGPATARNLAAAQGCGTLLAFLDADDRWDTVALEAHAQHFDAQPGLGISFGRTRFFDANLRIPGRISAHRPDLRLVDVLAENPLCTTSNIVVRRDLFASLAGFDPQLRHAEDQEFVARLLATTPYRVKGIDVELVHYRMSEGGLSADLASMEQGWRLMLERVRNYTDEHQFVTAERQSRALYARYLARRALRTGQPATRAWGHLLDAIRIDAPALFGSEGRRTVLTAAGAAAALLLPRRLINTIISR